jgi:hypothetical protein
VVALCHAVADREEPAEVSDNSTEGVSGAQRAARLVATVLEVALAIAGTDQGPASSHCGSIVASSRQGIRLGRAAGSTAKSTKGLRCAAASHPRQGSAALPARRINPPAYRA